MLRRKSASKPPCQVSSLGLRGAYGRPFDQTDPPAKQLRAKKGAPVSKSSLVFLTALALSVTTAGCGSSSADSPESNEATATAEVTTAETTTAEAAPTGAGAGSYIDLADYEANKAAYASTDVVLFFNAVWCSTCKVARDNIESDLSAIPSDLTIVAVDFDTAQDLRKKYGVTVQHTFVQVDPAGDELAKWAGSLTTEEIAQNTV